MIPSRMLQGVGRNVSPGVSKKNVGRKSVVESSSVITWRLVGGRIVAEVAFRYPKYN